MCSVISHWVKLLTALPKWWQVDLVADEVFRINDERLVGP